VTSKKPLPSDEKILRAARQLLLKVGHERISLREVARRARFAPSSIYEHFPNRQALLEALARAALRDIRREIALACGAPEVSFGDRLLGAARVYLAFASERAREFELIFSRVQPDLAAPPAESPLVPVLTEISRAVGAGECRPPAGLDVLDVAVALWTQVHGLAVLRLRYLGQSCAFEEKSMKIVTAMIGAWLPVAGEPS
jgi:AcrR family transcriptional regulator